MPHYNATPGYTVIFWEKKDKMLSQALFSCHKQLFYSSTTENGWQIFLYKQELKKVIKTDLVLLL